MKFNLPKKPPGHALVSAEPPLHPTLPATGVYRSADESAARRHAIMARVNERRVLVKAAPRARHETARLRA